MTKCYLSCLIKINIFILKINHQLCFFLLSSVTITSIEEENMTKCYLRWLIKIYIFILKINHQFCFFYFRRRNRQLPILSLIHWHNKPTDFTPNISVSLAVRSIPVWEPIYVKEENDKQYVTRVPVRISDVRSYNRRENNSVKDIRENYF